MKNWEELYKEYQPKLQTVASRFARKYHCDHLLEDLVAACTIVFHKRMPRYDESKGTVWTYLRPFFLSAMQEVVCNCGYPAVIPHDKLQKIRKAHAIRSKYLHLPVDQQIHMVATEMDESQKYITSLLVTPLQSIPLDHIPADDECLEDLPGAFAPQPESVYKKMLELEWLQKTFASLTEREQDIVGGTFAIFGHRKRSFAELGEEYGETADSIRKAKNRALEQMREEITTGMAYFYSIPAAIKAFIAESQE